MKKNLHICLLSILVAMVLTGCSYEDRTPNMCDIPPKPQMPQVAELESELKSIP